MDLFMLIFWIVLLVVLLIVEAATVQLVTIWFAIGAAAALIARICGAAQWVLFLVVSAVTLAATRPLVRKITKQKTQPTNADRCIGETAMVTEDIDNIAGKGRVEVNGISWTARSSDGANFRKGELVTVERIEGVKLIVKAQN